MTVEELIRLLNMADPKATVYAGYVPDNPFDDYNPVVTVFEIAHIQNKKSEPTRESNVYLGMK